MPADHVVHTLCPLDCPDTCSVAVRVDPDAGRVLKLDGDTRNPVTAGTICGKVRRFDHIVHGDDRLTHPEVRSGPKGSGKFRRVSWDEALDSIARRLRENAATYGGESILPLAYGGSNGLLSDGTTDELLFRRLGASRLARTVCAAAVGRAHVGLYGKMPGVAYDDVPEARLVVLWGANPSDSGIHLVPQILEAQRRGAALVVVDPRRTPLARKADLHLPVRPGTDLPLALAVTHRLFETDDADLEFLRRETVGWQELRTRAAAWTVERAAAVCGLDTDDIERFVRLYAESSPALLRIGWGQERNRNGGSASAALFALPAVGGKFGVRGGGYLSSNSGSWMPGSLVDDATDGPLPRLVNMNRIGRLLTDPGDEPPVRCLFVYNCNPLQTLPRQDLMRRGLEREDLFTVVFDPVLTDTARYADVVLPATTFLEQRDLRRAYGAYVIGDVVPAIPPVGEARSNVDVFAELCRRCDVLRDDDPTTAEELRERALAQLPADARARLDAGEVVTPPCGAHPVQMVDVRPRTDDGKIHLVPAALDTEARAAGSDGLYAYREAEADGNGALTLISPASRQAISSSLYNLVEADAVVDLHPDDAASRGIASGDLVRLVAALDDLDGEVEVRARVGDLVRPGVAALPKGLWARHTRNGVSANALAPDTLTDLGGGACFNDARVRVERAG
ncbi:MAG: molybdopterin-dependent oxidoreductase [Acidobacteriota bacterium]